MSLRLFCQQWRAHMVPGIHTPACRMEKRPLSVAVVCLVWRGVTMNGPCARTCTGGAYECGRCVRLFVCLFFCDSILLDFWAQSVVHMVLAALWMANVSVTLKPVRQDWGAGKAGRDWKSIWQKDRARTKTKRCNDSLSGLPFVLHLMPLECR